MCPGLHQEVRLRHRGDGGAGHQRQALPQHRLHLRVRDGARDRPQPRHEPRLQRQHLPQQRVHHVPQQGHQGQNYFYLDDK